MVLSSSVEVARMVEDPVPMSSVKEQEARRNAVVNATVPVPMSIVRSCLEEFEHDLVEQILRRESGSDVLPNGWRDGPTGNKGIKVVYGEVAGSEWYTMKTTGKLRVSAEKAARVLMSAKMVPKFDDMTKQVDLLERLSDATEVRHVSCKSVMFTAARDFCVASTMTRDPSGRIIIATKSVDHPNGNPSGFCRALSYISGYILTPDAHDPNACELAVIAHMDLGGHMPAMVVRYLGLSAPIKLVEKIDEVTYSA